MRDGLPTTATYCSAQDREGFMWIGTEAGLVRYDGEHFLTYTKRDGLPDNEVLDIISDTITDRLWLTTFSRVPCYYRHGRIYTPANDSSLRIIHAPLAEFITGNLDSDRVFLFNGGYIYECAYDHIKPLEHMAMSTGVHRVRYWGGDQYDLLNEYGITANHPDGYQRIYTASGVDSSESGAWFGRTLARLFTGKILFYKKRPDGEYEREGSIEIPVKSQIIRIIQTPTGYLFYGMDQGVYAADRHYKSVHKIWSGKGGAGIMLDRSGDLWITTGNDGIYVLRSEQLQNIRPFASGDGNNISSVDKMKNGDVMIGNTDGRLFRLHGSRLQEANYALLKPGRIRRVVDMGQEVLILAKDCEVADLRAHRTRNFYTISGGGKNALMLKDGKTVLIGQIGTMLKYDLSSAGIHEIATYKRIFDMAERSDGQVMAGSIDGLYIYEQDTMRHVSDPDPALSGRISSLCYTSDDLLWAGTPADGIIIYDGHQVRGHISSAIYPAYHGVMCRRIIAGYPGELWIATNYGMNKISYHRSNDSVLIDNIIPFTSIDGLLSDDVNDIALVDSSIYIATSAGLSILSEANVAAPRAIPVYITAVRINDRDTVLQTETYQLRYDQNNLRIDYIGLSMPRADNLRYQYRLLGAGHDEWTTTANTSIEFRSLSPGSYTFEVVVLDKFGHRGASVAKVKFEITPAFYNTVWFWASIMLLILISGFLVIRERFRRQQERFQKEQSLHNKIIELEQQALKAQMNPHFIFNCLTAVQHFVNTEDMYSANMYLSNFARLIRKTLDLSGEQYISLDQEIAYLQDYIQMERLRFGDRFTSEIHVAENIDTFAVEVPPMLLQPIVENAIRHGLRNLEGRPGILLLDFKMDGTALHCTLEDNGIGRDKARLLKTSMHVEYQSKGMALTAARIQAIDQISPGKISISILDKMEDGQAMGTMITMIVRQS